MKSEERLIICGGATHPHSIGQKCDIIQLLVRGKLRTIMSDCGMEFLREVESGGIGPAPDLSLLDAIFGGDAREKVDVLFHTHSHIDHIGADGWLSARRYIHTEATIPVSPQTAAVMPIALQDGLKQQSFLMPYNAFDAARVINRIKIIPKPGVYELLPGLEVFVPQMGHIPGACGIVIPTSSGKNELITGDVCWHDQPVTNGALLPSQSWPKEWMPDGILSTDLTYGSGAKRPLQEEVDRLIIQVGMQRSRGKKVIIAAFGNGRGQNVAVWLAQAGITVYIDGMIRGIYKKFQETRWSERDGALPPLGRGSRIVPIESEDHREDLIASSEPVVIITTAGMGDFGPIVRYMEAGLGSKRWVFYFTSWLAPGSKGAELWEKKKRCKEPYTTLVDKKGNKQIVKVRASVDRFSLSAHGDLDQFVAFVEDIVGCRSGKPLDRVVLTHGTQETKARAASRLWPKLAKEIVYGERHTVLSL